VPDIVERRDRLLALVAAQSQNDADGLPSSLLSRICLAVDEDMSGSGAGITVMSGAGWRGVVAATNPLSEQMEELQLVCGEGPCLDAVRLGHPILVDDLEDRVWGDWTGYAPAAQAAGVRAVFAFPIHVGAARVGALDVYRLTAGSLSPVELADGLVFAEFALTALLDGQESAPAGQLAAAVDEAFDYRIYQAQGMVSVQLEVDLLEAMARLRGYALANELRLSEVAQRVLSGQLHLEGDES
jgi:hypothetical protein